MHSPKNIIIGVTVNGNSYFNVNPYIRRPAYGTTGGALGYFVLAGNVSRNSAELQGAFPATSTPRPTLVDQCPLGRAVSGRKKVKEGNGSCEGEITV